MHFRSIAMEINKGVNKNNKEFVNIEKEIIKLLKKTVIVGLIGLSLIILLPFLIIYAYYHPSHPLSQILLATWGMLTPMTLVYLSILRGRYFTLKESACRVGWIYTHNPFIDDEKWAKVLYIMGIGILFGYVIIPLYTIPFVCNTIFGIFLSTFILTMPYRLKRKLKKNGLTLEHYLPYPKNAEELVSEIKDFLGKDGVEIKKYGRLWKIKYEGIKIWIREKPKNCSVCYHISIVGFNSTTWLYHGFEIIRLLSKYDIDLNKS